MFIVTLCFIVYFIVYFIVTLFVIVYFIVTPWGTLGAPLEHPWGTSGGCAFELNALVLFLLDEAADLYA